VNELLKITVIPMVMKLGNLEWIILTVRSTSKI
jgi:hypothetical protein